MHTLDSRRFRLGFAAVVLFTGLAGDFWRNLLGWYGYGAVIAIIVAASITVLVHRRKSLRLGQLPYPLLAFLLLATVSIAWSYYPGSSAMGATAQWVTTAAAVTVATVLSWPEILLVLGTVLRVILGLSFLFEFIVAVFIRHPVLPVWVVPDNPDKIPQLAYWSRDLLFHGGKIQGIIGNSSLLAMIALLAIIVFAIQLASRSVGRFWGWFWIAVAAITLAIAQSATIYVALVIVVIVALMALLVRAASTPRARGLAYAGIAAAVVVVAAVGILLRSPILKVLGKSSELTGRTDIWNEVIRLAEQRPVFGWGWVSYWTPWVEPFKSFLKKGGVQVMHAHDAWLDVWLQLGILGLIVFIALVLSTLVRSWFMATDRTVTAPDAAGHHSWLTLLPLLILTAQLVQSVAESRILIEGGWALLVLWAVKTKLTPLDTEAAPIPVDTGAPPTPAARP
jgi:exopolysaccharide production protein ExoQ